MITYRQVELAIGWGLLLVTYAALDFLLRKGKLLEFLRARRLHGQAPLIIGSLGSALLVEIATHALPQSGALRIFAGVVACTLAYSAATRDLDPTLSTHNLTTRWTALAAAVFSLFEPALLITVSVLLGAGLQHWSHHATLPMRVLQVLVAHQLLLVLPAVSPVVPAGVFGVVPVVSFVVVVIVSHYFITALAKAWLGRHPFDWMLNNQLHHLSASAYSWGWARFLPWTSWRRVVRMVRNLERPLQVGAFSLELLSPLALFSPNLAQGFLLAAACFHMGVFALSGLLFWDWIVVGVVTAWFVHALPAAEAQLAFNPGVAGLGFIVLVLFPLRQKVWQPVPLGWFDTPLTARIHWEVKGESGDWYGVYNDFMCPHERLYGRVHGCFFVPYPVVTYHLGEVWKVDLRDAILAAGPSSERLSEVRQKFGIKPNSTKLRDQHVRYLQAFFSALNAGARKSLLPSWAWLLKAPGDQIFYWGALPSYRRQEPVQSVRLRFVEEYFDGDRLVRLHEQIVAQFDVPDIPPACDAELRPEELDHYLLGLAEGRLIDIEGIKRRYVRRAT